MSKFFRVFATGVMLFAILLLATPMLAQFGEAKGSLFGRVEDEQGGALPGVAVTLSGQGAPATATTDARGEFRFLNLAVGSYKLTLALAGFGTVNRENVQVALGRNTELVDTMKLSSVAATVTVTSETPLIDTRKVETGSTVTQAELASIPTGRDPWVLLQSIPGVMVDRVNVAGSENGQQSVFSSKGSNLGSFTLDGVNLTDMSALGSSANYYDFDTFQEVQVITGGPDPAIQGSGAHINMITKRGTNEVHGSSRVNYVSDWLQATNYPPTPGRREIDTVTEFGAEVGGAVIKDRLWLWGAYGRNQINILVGAGSPPGKQNTTLENVNGKLNWQVIPSNSFTATGQYSNKLVFGRGLAADRPLPATTDQVLPQNIWKFEDSQVVSSNLFFSAMYAGQNGFFGLVPEGTGQLFYDANVGFAGTSYYFLESKRPTRQLKGDVSYFLTTGSLGHELKAGFQYLQAGETAVTGSPANVQSDPDVLVKVGGFLNFVGCDDEGENCVPAAGIFRDRNVGVESKYYGAFFGDTITADRLTVALGVRWDRQSGINLASTAGANPSFPGILPAVVYGGAPKEFTWDDWSPRAGITYALGDNRNTVVKASYARFVDALGSATVSYTNPLGGSAGAYYPWNDDGDGLVETGEVNTAGTLLKNFGYNLADPGSAGSPANAIDPNLKAGTTDEFIGGVDHEIMPGFAAGVSYTYRKYKNPVALATPFDAGTGIIVRNTDYVQYDTLSGTLPDGTPYGPVPVYEVSPAVLATLTDGGYPGGQFYDNQGNYNQTYSGFEVTLTKRLANRWMARANFNYGINKQNVEGDPLSAGFGCQGDPNNGPLNSTTGFGLNTCRDGDYLTQQSVGSGRFNRVYLNSKYTYNFTGMYQLPLDFNIAASFFGRQGYPVNYYRTTTAPNDKQTRAIVVTPINEIRYGNLNELDLRLEKVIPFAATAAATVAVDCFNITNNATILQRRNLLSSPSNVDEVQEVQNPRVFRWSVRISF